MLKKVFSASSCGLSKMKKGKEMENGKVPLICMYVDGINDTSEKHDHFLPGVV